VAKVTGVGVVFRLVVLFKAVETCLRNKRGRVTGVDVFWSLSMRPRGA